MELRLHIHVGELPEGLFLATSGELPEPVAQGRRVAQALEIARTSRASSLGPAGNVAACLRLQLQRSVAAIRSGLSSIKPAAVMRFGSTQRPRDTPGCQSPRDMPEGTLRGSPGCKRVF